MVKRLLILAGDIQMAWGNKQEALVYFDQAVNKAHSVGRDVTEMRARALLQRGRTKKSLGNRAGAETDFNVAARIWTEIEEPNFTAEAEFEVLSLSVELSEHERTSPLHESAAVRVQTL